MCLCVWTPPLGPTHTFHQAVSSQTAWTSAKCKAGQGQSREPVLQKKRAVKCFNQQIFIYEASGNKKQFSVCSLTDLRVTCFNRASSDSTTRWLTRLKLWIKLQLSSRTQQTQSCLVLTWRFRIKAVPTSGMNSQVQAAGLSRAVSVSSVAPLWPQTHHTHPSLPSPPQSFTLTGHGWTISQDWSQRGLFRKIACVHSECVCIIIWHCECGLDVKVSLGRIIF